MIEATPGSLELAGSRSPWSSARERLLANRAAILAASLLTAVLVAALIGPWLSPHDMESIDWSLSPLASPPSIANGHWFGTDANGRDLFVRVSAGTRVSLLVALLASVVSLVIGVAWGATAGYLGGRVDEWMMRFVDVLYALPYMFFVIVLTVLMGPNPRTLIVVIGVLSWMELARIIRANFLSLKHKEFAECARAVGVGDLAIMFRHILPNTVAPIIVAGTLGVGQAMLAEAAVSYLGLGVQPPTADWGTMLAEGQLVLLTSPHVAVASGLAIVLAVLGFNLLGDGLRDVLDPRQAQR